MRTLILSTAAALGTLLAGCGAAQEDPRRPNVLCIVVDTLRADRLGLYGHARPTSPALDELGRRSLVVDTMVAQSSWTKPSVASLFTSLFASQHRVVEETTRNRLAAPLVTLAERLQASGYVTAGFSENPHVAPATGFDQGFDLFRTRTGFQADSAWVLGQALGWLDQARGRERPFLLYLHFLDPHGPYEPQPALRAEFVGELATDDERVRQGLVGQLVQGTELLAELGPADVEYLRALYDAEVRQTDAALERLFGYLSGHGLLERTVVVVTSDHGEEFLEHGTLKHGYQLYEESLRVPLILHVPGSVPRRVTDAVVQHVDVAPTLLDVLDLPVPESFRGRSFAGLLRGESLPDRPVVSESSWRGIDLRAVRSEGWKLIVDAKAGTRELYRLDEDPDERRDRAGARPQLVAELERLLEQQLRPLPDALFEHAQGEGDPEAERALRALGYFGK